MFRNEKCGQTESSKRVVENLRKQTAFDRVQKQSSKPQRSLGSQLFSSAFCLLKALSSLSKEVLEGLLVAH